MTEEQKTGTRGEKDIKNPAGNKELESGRQT
jgi:hypothetical protein